jgi:hypothetical protein
MQTPPSSLSFKQILFALHGLIDNNQGVGSLAHQVAPHQTYFSYVLCWELGSNRRIDGFD